VDDDVLEPSAQTRRLLLANCHVIRTVSKPRSLGLSRPKGIQLLDDGIEVVVRHVRTRVVRSGIWRAARPGEKP